jgi:hypothetical protein
MNKSILPDSMKGVMFVTGYRGKGKTFLAAHADLPSNIAFFDFDEGKAEGLHNQLHFGYYKPVTENTPLVRAAMFLSEIEKLPQNKFTVAIIDNINQLEKAIQAIVYQDAKKYADIYGYTVASVMKDDFGKARGIANDLIGDAIAKPLHAKGVKLIIVTSHVKEKYNSPGKMTFQGRDRWQDLSILTLILGEGTYHPIPSATVFKEALGSISVTNTNLTDDQYNAIMQGELASHDIIGRFPPRLPKADWQSIRKYLHTSVDLNNLTEEEKLNLEESEPFTEKMSKEQIAYQLGVLEKEASEKKEVEAMELLIRQEQETAIKEYIKTNLAGMPSRVIVDKLKSVIKSGKLVYNNEITIDKASKWSGAQKKEEAPPEFILIPIGEYNGVDLPDCIIDENYIIWLKIPNPELNCEVIWG